MNLQVTIEFSLRDHPDQKSGEDVYIEDVVLKLPLTTPSAEHRLRLYELIRTDLNEIVSAFSWSKRTNFYVAFRILSFKPKLAEVLVFPTKS